MQPNLTAGQIAHLVFCIEDTLRPEFIDAHFIERRDFIDINSPTELLSELSSSILDRLNYELGVLCEMTQDDFEKLFSQIIEQTLTIAARRYPEILHQLDEDPSAWFTTIKTRAHALFIECSSHEISDEFEQLYFNATIASRRGRQLGLTETDRTDFVDSIESWFVAKIDKYSVPDSEISHFNYKENLERIQKWIRFKARMAISLLGVMSNPLENSPQGFIEQELLSTIEGLGIYGDKANTLRIEIGQHIMDEVSKRLRSNDRGSQ